MKILLAKLITTFYLILILNINVSHANILENIKILGNDRISNDTIKLFSKVSLNEKIDQNKLNEILRNLYETDFFSDVSVKIQDNLDHYCCRKPNN